MTITRKPVRDGVIVSEEISVEFSDNATNVASEMAALRKMAVFQSAPERIAAYRQAAQDTLKSSTTGSRAYAELAVQRLDRSLSYLEKVIQPSARHNAESAILELIRAFEAIWVIDVKGVEPEIVTGGKSRRSNAKGNEFRSLVAAQDRDRWQCKADTIWAVNPRLSKQDVAKKIDPNRCNTIRRFITKVV